MIISGCYFILSDFYSIISMQDLLSGSGYHTGHGQHPGQHEGALGLDAIPEESLSGYPSSRHGDKPVVGMHNEHHDLMGMRLLVVLIGSSMFVVAITC